MRSRLKNIKWKPNIFKKEYAPNHDYLKQAFSKKINLQSYYPNNIPSSFIGIKQFRFFLIFKPVSWRILKKIVYSRINYEF